MDAVSASKKKAFIKNNEASIHKKRALTYEDSFELLRGHAYFKKR